MEASFREHLGKTLARNRTRLPGTVRIFDDCPSPTDFPTAILSSVTISIEIYPQHTSVPVSLPFPAGAESPPGAIIDCDFSHGDCGHRTDESLHATVPMILDGGYQELSPALALLDEEDEPSLAFSSQSTLSSTTDVESARHDGRIIELVMIGLQNAVCGTVPKNGEVMGDGKAFTLMDIAPAVFDLTYRDVREPLSGRRSEADMFCTDSIPAGKVGTAGGQDRGNVPREG